MPIFVGVARLELHIPEARSLKDKRRQTLSLLQRLRARHQALVIEADGQDLYQRAGFAICVMSTSVTDAEARLQRISNTVDENWCGNILSWDVEVLQIWDVINDS